MIDNLKDAITHAREVAETQRGYTKAFGDKPVTGAAKNYVNLCLECASEHDQLAEWLTELDERREADRWISVKERLPEPRVEVMVYCPERKTQYCAFYADKHWRIFGSYDTVWGEVTHWRPLPKTPESEAESLDYQRAVEDTEYCKRHEPTYNPDDGSM